MICDLRRTTTNAPALLLALSLLACGTPAPDPVPSRDTGRKVAVIGWDGADWEIARPLMKAGRMPALAGLVARGASADLHSMVPTLSPLLWTTVATGRPPEVHGVLDFLQPDPAGGKPQPIAASARQVPALWEMAAAAGRRVGVVGWWATHPAERLPGFMVSDRLAYTLLDGVAGSAVGGEGCVTPDELLARASVVPPEQVPDELLAGLLGPGPPNAGAEEDLRRIVAAALTYERATLAGLRDGQPDLLLTYFSLIDQASHRFADCAAPALPSCPEEERGRFRDTVEAVYELQDRLLAELLAVLDPDTEILLLSDHGFLSGDRRPAGIPPDVRGRPGRWHRLTGLFVIAGPAAATGTIPPMELLDVAPTVLGLLGLPVGREMEGAIRLDALRPSVRDDLGPEPVPSWADLVAPAEGIAVPEDGATRRQIEQLESLGYLSAAGERVIGSRTVAAEVNLASRLAQAGRLDEADAALERALGRAGDYVPALLARAEVELRQGRRAEAVAGLTRAIELDGGSRADPQLLLQWAELAGPGAGSTEAVLEEAARSRPADADLLAARGLRIALRDPQAAARLFERALAIQPAHRQALAGLFAAVDEGGADAGAALERCLRRALEREPDGVMTRNWLALRLARDPAGAPEAVALLRRAHALAPDHAGTLVNLGSLLGSQGDLDGAEESFRDAVRLAPGDVAARVGLATTLARAGDLVDARRILEETPSPAREDPRLLNTLALVHRDLGEPQLAVEALRSSLARRPDQPDARRLLRDLEGGS